MANIMRREEQRALEPLRWMRDLFRWDPLREIEPWMERTERTFTPALDVKETRDGFVLKADLPGVNDKDVEVKLTGNRLAISGKREYEHEDKSDTYYTYERDYGSFVRAFTLPDSIDSDHVTAELKDGVLTVAVPKKASAQTKTVTVKPGEAKS
jgi:HSP20 family protein